MVQPRWPDGRPIKGVTIKVGKHGYDSTFELDFDLVGPTDASERADAALLSILCNSYGFLPDRADLLRQVDLKEIVACVHFTEKRFQKTEHSSEFNTDLTMALICMCFRDDEFRASALEQIIPGKYIDEKFDVGLASIVGCCFELEHD